MKQKLINLKALLCLLLLLVGVNASWADSFNTTYNYAGVTADPATWSLTNCTDKDSYWLVPSGSNPSVATLPGVFEGKTVTSDVVVTLNVACYGSGTNPSASTFSLYKETACTNAITATKGGTLPTSSTYTDVTYTITQTNAASLSGDLAIKITKPGKQIRLKSINVTFTYTSTSDNTPTLVTTGGDLSSNTLAFGNTYTDANPMPTKTFNLSGTNLTANASLAISGTDASIFQVSPTSVTQTSGSIASTAITVTYTPTAAGDHTATLTISSTGATDKTISLTGTGVDPIAKHTAHFSVNGTIDNANDKTVNEGDKITFPADPADISGKKFVGWCTTQDYSNATTAPTYADKNNTNMGDADVTYYAVFATQSAGTTTWNQVTTLANITEGQYVIKNGSYVLSNEVASSSAPAALTAPTVTSGVMTGTVEDNMKWNLTSTGTANQFYVKNPDGKYLYETSNNNGLRVNTTSDKWTFEKNTTGYFAMKGANNSRYCAQYSAGSDWRSYTSATASNYTNSGKLELYKLSQNVSYSDYSTSVVVKTLQSISVTGTPEEFWIGDEFNHNGMTVTATWDAGDPTDVTAQAQFSTPDMTTAGQKTVTVTYKDKTCTYNIDVKTIANTQETAYTTAEAIAKINANKDLATEVYIKGTVSKVDNFNDTYGSITYWLDSDAFEIYGGLNNNGAKFTSIDDIKVGAEVVVYGYITKYDKSTPVVYETKQNSWLVSYTAPAASKSTATLTLGTYKSALTTGADDEYTVTYNGDGTVSVTSSDETVAKAIIVEGTVMVSAKKAGTTTIQVSAPETENYYAANKSYTLTVTDPAPAAELPFTFDGGKGDIASKTGMSQTGLSTDYDNSPKLKFDGAGDNVIINYASTARNVTYKIKGNSTTSSTVFDVLESADGKTYTTVHSFSGNVPTDATSYTDKLKSDSRYVKFVYTTKSGNVALGAITITNEKADPGLAFSQPEYRFFTDTEDKKVSATSSKSSTGAITYALTTGDAEKFTINNSGNITCTTAGTYTVTATIAETEDNRGGTATCTVQIKEPIVANSIIVAEVEKDGVKSYFAMTNTVDEDHLTSVEITKAGDIYYVASNEILNSIKYATTTSEGKTTIVGMNGQYLQATAAKAVSFTDTEYQWTNDGEKLTAATESHGTLQYNTGSPRFTTYTNKTGQYAQIVSLDKVKVGSVVSVTLYAACTDGEMVYGTFSSSKAFKVPADVTISEISISNNKLNVQSYAEGASVPANTGVMVSSATAGVKYFEVTTGGTSVLGKDNCLKPSGDNGITYSEMGTAAPNCTYYRLTMHNGTQIGFWYGAADGDSFNLAENKAYLAVPKDSEVKASFWIGNNDATVINSVSSTLDENAPVYNLSGQRVSHTTKGIVIQNGKKFINK